jgi:hypothetical protein
VGAAHRSFGVLGMLIGNRSALFCFQATPLLQKPEDDKAKAPRVKL